MRQQYETAMALEDVTQRKTIPDIVDERSDIYRKRNRNRAIAGVAIAAATSFGGYAASEWLSDHVDLTKPFRWAGSKMSEKVSDLRHNGLRNQFDDDASDASQTQGWGDIQVPSGDAQAPSIDAGGNGIGSESAKNALHDYVDAHQKDFTIKGRKHVPSDG